MTEIRPASRESLSFYLRGVKDLVTKGYIMNASE